MFGAKLECFTIHSNGTFAYQVRLCLLVVNQLEGPPMPAARAHCPTALAKCCRQAKAAYICGMAMQNCDVLLFITCLCHCSADRRCYFPACHLVSSVALAQLVALSVISVSIACVALESPEQALQPM